MIELVEFIQLGVSGVAIIVIFLIVKEFLSFIHKQENNFSDTINNHIKYDTEAKNKLEKSNEKLTTTIDLLYNFLKNHK